MENNLDFFDDVSNHAESLWGSYLAVPAPIVSRGQLRAELQDAAVGWSLFDDLHVTAHETSAYRRNQSVRTTGKGLDYNWEPNFQWGSFGSASIRAWSVSAETGFTFDRIRFCPRPLLRADVCSGDGNSANQALGTFNPLFPRSAYFTPAVVPFLGPQNFIDLHPAVQFQRKRNATGAFAWVWYWRESTHDGIYAFGSEGSSDSRSR